MLVSALGEEQIARKDVQERNKGINPHTSETNRGQAQNEHFRFGTKKKKIFSKQGLLRRVSHLKAIHYNVENPRVRPLL